MDITRKIGKYLLIKLRDYVWLPFWSLLWCPFFFVMYITVFAPVGRIITWRRRRLLTPPRIVLAAYALPQTYYMQLAGQRAGYDSRMIVWYPSYYNREWEVGNLWKIIAWIGRFIILPRYVMFLWSLVRFDIFQYYFNQQQLSSTILSILELRLLKLAGKKIILSPYGGDAFVRGMKTWNGDDLIDILSLDYPRIYEVEKQVKRDLKIGANHADLILGTPPHTDIMPRCDQLRHTLCIDVSEWQISSSRSRDEVVRIAHSSNHRNIKGTKYIIAACERLLSTGYTVDLDIIERVSREEVKRRFAEADIIVEQLIIGIYGMSAVEAMALGKPVVSYIRDDVSMLKMWHDCPVVNANPDTLYDRLVELVSTDPQKLLKLGSMGRRYVEQEHSIKAWSKINDGNYKKLWL